MLYEIELYFVMQMFISSEILILTVHLKHRKCRGTVLLPIQTKYSGQSLLITWICSVIGGISQVRHGQYMIWQSEYHSIECSIDWVSLKEALKILASYTQCNLYATLYSWSWFQLYIRNKIV